MKLAAVGLFLAVFTAGTAVRADDPVHSRWRTEDVRIDGVMSDWPGLTFVSKEMSTSVVNDGQDLFLIVATSDPAVNLQVTRAGLAVYLDPKGGKGQTFGVRIPPLGSRLAPENAPSAGEGVLLSYFDVLGPGVDDLRRVQVDEVTGIELRVGTHEGTFFMELKVPFVAGPGHPYAPGIDLAKGEVGLGIVTPEPPRVARPPERRGGGGFTIGGGMSGGGGVRAPAPPKGKAVKVWTKIVLAKER